MTVDEALGFFENMPKIRDKLQALWDVGLDYIKVGQPSTTSPAARAACEDGDRACQTLDRKHTFMC
jgi:hypothetical protein